MVAIVAGQSDKVPSPSANQTNLGEVRPAGAQIIPTPLDAQVSLSIPEDQKRLLAAIDLYAGEFATASNDLQRSVLRDERRAALREALSSQLSIEGWVGTIRRLQTNMEGKAVLTVSLSPSVSIMTWNNAFSDIFDETMIEKGTPAYNVLLNMSVGERVLISGRFLISDEDFIKDSNITINSSMTEPSFLFRFQRISTP